MHNLHASCGPIGHIIVSNYFLWVIFVLVNVFVFCTNCNLWSNILIFLSLIISPLLVEWTLCSLGSLEFDLLWTLFIAIVLAVDSVLLWCSQAMLGWLYQGRDSMARSDLTASKRIHVEGNAEGICNGNGLSPHLAGICRGMWSYLYLSRILDALECVRMYIGVRYKSVSSRKDSLTLMYRDL